MSSKEIVISRRAVYTISLAFVILVALLVFGGKFSILGSGNAGNVDSSKLVAGSPEKFDVLSRHDTRGNVGST